MSVNACVHMIVHKLHRYEWVILICRDLIRPGRGESSGEEGARGHVREGGGRKVEAHNSDGKVSHTAKILALE